MRPEVKDRFYKTYTYQPVDRVPDYEFGYWPQTIRRWLKEGMKLELTPEEQTWMFNWKVDAHFGIDGADWAWCGPRSHMNPPFQDEVLERRGDSVISRGSDGVIAQRYMHDVEESSIPHYIEFPVKGPEDWTSMKERYRLDDPTRVVPASDFEYLRREVAAGKMVSFGGVGFYGQLRNWMGFENLSTAFYEYPEMIHDMVDAWASLYVAYLEALPAEIPIDLANWWEDMASKNGPFTGPNLFREFLQPGYHRVMEAAKRRGCVLGIVDCDGNPHDIVANWIEEGVNIMFPLEVAAGVDAYAWRKEFGRELRMRGAIAKTPLAQGRVAIDAELERIRPLLEQGGFIPHLDHLVPPDISYDNYRYYRDRKMRLIGK